MSRQKVSTNLRYALWAAHDFKCFYHNEPLRWDELCIDHIIPEYLADKPIELAFILKQVGLEPGWSLTDPPNLAPSCHTCNQRKRDKLLPPNQLMLYLHEAEAKAPEVDVLRKRFNEERRIGRAQAQLEFALASGLIAETDIGRMLAAAVAGEDLVALTPGIQLFEGMSIDRLSPSNVDQLLDTPVKLGAYLPNGLMLSHNDGSTAQVRTVREYRQASEAGYFGMTTFDMKMEAFFVTTSGVLTALAACRPSSRSFIRMPRVGLCDIELLPSSLLIRFGEELEEETALLEAHPTIGKLIEAEAARVAWVSSSAIGVEFGSMRTSLREILRADLDGDGSEDILVARHLNAISGTLGLGLEPIALARRSLTNVFEVTELLMSPVPAS
jgi:hypothetical protein